MHNNDNSAVTKVWRDMDSSTLQCKIRVLLSKFDFTLNLTTLSFFCYLEQLYILALDLRRLCGSAGGLLQLLRVGERLPAARPARAGPRSAGSPASASLSDPSCMMDCF
jgi:hypothetical protein